MTSARGGGVAALVVGTVTFAYLTAFRSYGLNFEDEGLVLYQIQRVANGELPYVDFATGYTPGYFFLNAWLWRLAGNLLTLRSFLALVHAAGAAGLAALIAGVAPRALAILVPLLYVAFIPVFPGSSCAFNVPYPAWFATFAWIATVLPLAAFVRTRRRAWLVVAALGAAGALASKPNAGVFAIAATMAVVLLVPSRTGEERPSSAVPWWTLWTGIVVGPWLTLGGWPGTRDALAFLVPLTASLLALPARARTHRPDLLGDVVAVLATFLVVSVPWLVFFWHRLGTEGFLRDVLLIGSGAAQLYYVPYPPFETWALLLTAAVVGAAAAGYGLRSRRIRIRHVVALAALALLGLVAALARVSVMPERTTWSLIWQLESAGFPLVLVTHVVGTLWLWRTRGASELPAALLLCAQFMHLQVYPRADFMHLVLALPLSAAFAAFLLTRMLGWWCAGLADQGLAGARRLVWGTAIAILVAAIALRVTPGFAARLSEPGPRLPFALAPVDLERARSAVLEDLGSAARRFASLVPTGEPSLTFPAVDVFLFLTETRNPSPFSYFFPGRPDHREEAEIVDDLARTDPRALVTLNSAFTFFDDAPPYYFLLRRFVRSRYALRERAGRFDVLARVTGTPEPVVDTTHVDEGERRVFAFRAVPLDQAVPRLLALATGDDPTVRRAALTVLLDRSSEPGAAGLTRWVAEARLDRRREVLLLRTIRDTREVRASAHLFAAASSSDPRIANEALGAMFVTRAHLIAVQHLWAGPRVPGTWPHRDELLDALRRTLADPSAPPRATALAAHLAGVLEDGLAVPALRARLGGDPATLASALASLATLAPVEAATEATAALARPEAELRVLVPTTMLALADGPEPGRGAARARLAETAGRSGPAREQAVWIGAALSDSAWAPTFRAALADEAVGVRRAAAWALGEMPTDEATTGALMRAAASDLDSIVRRLASGAEAKQTGRAPRAAISRPVVGGAGS